MFGDGCTSRQQPSALAVSVSAILFNCYLGNANGVITHARVRAIWHTVRVYAVQSDCVHRGVRYINKHNDRIESLTTGNQHGGAEADLSVCQSAVCGSAVRRGNCQHGRKSNLDFYTIFRFFISLRSSYVPKLCITYPTDLTDFNFK